MPWDHQCVAVAAVAGQLVLYDPRVLGALYLRDQRMILGI